MHFDEVIRALQDAPDDTVTIPPDWAQGRAGFGGLLVALVHEGMRARLADDRPLRSLAVSFVGPATPGVPLEVRVEVLRQGGTVTHVEGRAVQGGETVSVVLGAFGAARESQVLTEPEAAPDLPGPDEAAELPIVAGVTPAFAQHVDLRVTLGDLPFTGSAERRLGGWVRFREPPAAMTDAHLVALVDAWPPTVLPQLRGPAPSSSLSWTLGMVHPRPVLPPDGWLLYEAVVDQARDGYGHTEAAVWSPEGDLLALSRQTVTVFG
ncbi:MAG: acyl-CoA thioesterase [Myxococcota bacterium]